MAPSMKTAGALALAREHWPSGLAIFICYWLLSNYYRRSLNLIPGPWIRGLSSIPRIWSVYHGFSHDDDIALHKTYGKIVRLAPNTVSISDPEAINTIYGIGTKFFKSKFYSLAEASDEEGVMPDPFILTNRELHARMKRNGANAYSLNGLVQMEPWIDPVTDRLVEKLKGFERTGKAVDIAPLMQGYAMDAVFALTFGKDLNHMDGGDYLGMFKTTKLANDYMAIFGQFAWIHPYLLGNPWIADYFTSSQGNTKMLQLAASEMEAGRERTSEEGPMTFLQRLLLNQKQNPKSLTDREIITHAWGNTAAGSDTTAIALRSIIFNTLKTPEVHEKLKVELRGNLTAPVKFTVAVQFPYLSAVIKEGIRLHPSVGLILGRVVPEGGATLCGHYLQPGVEVGINPWVLHRDPDIFPEPDRFHPERWLPSLTSEADLKLMNQSYIPFGHGAHTCSGRWISMMEMQKVVATLFLLFDMQLENDGRDYHFHNLWFTPQEGLRVQFKTATN